MIDVNKDGTIDFNEFLVVVVLMNRVNDLSSRLSFVFDMYGINIFFLK
jgi:Ca2+-binding EF-hand superfamily protein